MLGNPVCSSSSEAPRALNARAAAVLRLLSSFRVRLLACCRYPAVMWPDLRIQPHAERAPVYSVTSMAAFHYPADRFVPAPLRCNTRDVHRVLRPDPPQAGAGAPLAGFSEHYHDRTSMWSVLPHPVAFPLPRARLICAIMCMSCISGGRGQGVREGRRNPNSGSASSQLSRSAGDLSRTSAQ